MAAIVSRSGAQQGLVNVYVRRFAPQAGITGPQETIPIMNGTMGLSTWQNIFICEFDDGPRRKREVVVTVCKTG